MKHSTLRRMPMLSAIPLILGGLFGVDPAFSMAAETNGRGCAASETWDSAMNMCMPVPGPGPGTAIITGQFNAFGVISALPGPRGIDQFAAPNMFMLGVGRKSGQRQFLNIELMGTTELWTYPRRGYPQLLQIGEERSDGTAYVDAQHPHSSPLMGLTFSDTINLASSRTLKVSFAPRGESADGPIAFMHRDSARDNPDAPLGHHVGQDVGHISSTVFRTSLDLGRIIIEASAFNGSEPSPTKVDLPIDTPNSAALRMTYVLDPAHRVMFSAARVVQQDDQYPGATSAIHLSASLYDHLTLASVGTIDHAFIIGSIKRHPDGASLLSFLEEAVLERGNSDFWGRVETVQRLRSELHIPAPTASDSVDATRWVAALTAGYTHWSAPGRKLQVGLGTSVTIDHLPVQWSAAYDGPTPLTVRFIVQIRGSGHWAKAPDAPP
jgi:hypothetical protein